jgi:hypothetical protein
MDYSTQTPARKCACPPQSHAVRVRVAQGERSAQIDELAALVASLGYTSWAAAEASLWAQGMSKTELTRALLRQQPLVTRLPGTLGSLHGPGVFFASILE